MIRIGPESFGRLVGRVTDDGAGDEFTLATVADLVEKVSLQAVGVGEGDESANP